jgi:hypothetical protein
VVTAYDAYSNIKTNYAGSIYFTSTDSAAILPYTSSSKYTFTAGTGTNTFSGFTLKTTPSQTITVTDSAASISQTSSSITVNAAGAASFVVSGFPSPTIAGVAHSVTVTAKDVYGNTATSYGGTVKITSSDSKAVLPSNGGLTSGVGSFSVTLKTAGTQSITATDTVTSLITGSQTGITVNAASGDYFVVYGFPSPTVAGVAHSVTVIAYDAAGNVATGYAGTVAVTSSDSQAVLPVSAGLTSGVGSFIVTLKTAGTQSIFATDTVTSSITGLQNGITVTHASAVTNVVISPAGSSVTAGLSKTYSATASDEYGNTWDVTSSTTWSISSGAGGSWSSNVYTSATAGSWTVTGTYDSAPYTTGLTVNPAGLDHFVFNTVGTQTAGSAFSITVTAKDVYGNTVTSYSGTPSLTYSAGSISPVAMNAFVSGVGSTSVTVTAAGSGVTITATDGSISGSSNSFTVNPTISASAGAGGSISPTGIVSVNYGGSQSFTITANPSYYIVDVTVNGSSVGAVSSYTFTNVQAAYTISATFAPTPTPSPSPTPTPTPAPTPTPKPTATPTPSPTPTPSTTTVPATIASGATVDLAISGNITSSQISNSTITPYQSTTTTTVSLIITGPNGTVGFVNMTIPKTAIPYGTSPVVYINGQQAPNQGYTQDANNFYVWYTTQFNTNLVNWWILGGLQVTIQFAVPSTPPASSLGLVLAVGIAVAAIILIFAVIAIKRLRRKPNIVLLNPKN